MEKRIILFRVWCIDSKKYLKGDFSIGIETGEFRSKYGQVYQNVIIEQFTGLTDKNGVKIFEGDKVKHWKYGECIIIWNRFSCSFQLHPFPNTELISTEMLSHVDEYTFEVIGNIHD